MIDISSWMDNFVNVLETAFAGRLWFVGLQGSYARGEATEVSDIDAVVILDHFTVDDICAYGNVLDSLPHRELICGFISGKEEILNWDTADLFQFYHDTLPYRGSLDPLLSQITDDSVVRAIKMGAGNIYHGCVHNMLHGKSADALRGLYKSASFVVQAIAYLQTGEYFRRLDDLRPVVSPEERQIIDIFEDLKKGGHIDFISMSEILFNWSGGWIKHA